MDGVGFHVEVLITPRTLPIKLDVALTEIHHRHATPHLHVLLHGSEVLLIHGWVISMEVLGPLVVIQAGDTSHGLKVSADALPAHIVVIAELDDKVREVFRCKRSALKLLLISRAGVIAKSSKISPQ